MIIRLLVLLGTLAVAYGAAGVLERRRQRRGPLHLPGVTLVSAPGCTLCPAVRVALRGVDVREIDVSAVPGVRSVPTVIVTDSSGAVTMRRSGRSAITDAATIISAAQLARC